MKNNISSIHSAQAAALTKTQRIWVALLLTERGLKGVDDSGSQSLVVLKWSWPWVIESRWTVTEVNGACLRLPWLDGPRDTRDPNARCLERKRKRMVHVSWGYGWSRNWVSKHPLSKSLTTRRLLVCFPEEGAARGNIFIPVKVPLKRRLELKGSGTYLITMLKVQKLNFTSGLLHSFDRSAGKN